MFAFFVTVSSRKVCSGSSGYSLSIGKRGGWVSMGNTSIGGKGGQKWGREGGRKVRKYEKLLKKNLQQSI